MFVTMVEAQVAPERESDLHLAWDNTTAAPRPAGLLESLLLKSGDGLWRIVTIWESEEALLAMRAAGRPAAIVMFQDAGARPEPSMWTVEGHLGRS